MAGRPKGSPKTGGRIAGVSRNKATKEAKDALEKLARKYTTSALRTLAEVAEKGVSEPARVAAAVALLDRGHGKPRQAVDLSSDPTRPIVIEIVDFTLRKNSGSERVATP
jgi:hypothetical protein